MIERSRVVQIIMACLDDLDSDQLQAGAADISEDMVLFGPGSGLDSLGLVTLLVDVEQRINDEFDSIITIMDDRAMSQRHSPFRSVGSLTDYIMQLLQEQ